MHRRPQPLHDIVDAFAARGAFARLHQLLEMAHGAADHLGRLGVRHPQPFQFAVQFCHVAAACRIAGAFAARFGFVAHHGADVFQPHLLLAMHVQKQLFNLPPRHAAIRAQPRHRLFQRIGRDGEALGAQGVAHHIAQIAQRIGIALQGGGTLVAVKDFPQCRGLGQVAGLDHH